MLIVVRHGERCDLVQDESERARVTVQSDSPLTHCGVQMAQRTGAKIKEMLAGDEANLRVISSPFARCLQTSQAICESLPSVAKIWVDYKACEYLNPRWYETDPLQQLMIVNSPEFQASMRVPLDFLSPPYPQFPETWDDLFTRYSEGIQDDFRNWVKCGENVVVVTHGYFAEIFATMFDPSQSVADYCSITAARRKDEWLELLLRKDTTHIADLLSQT